MKKNNLHTFVVLAYEESLYLEACIKSVLNQKYKSNVVIATSTPNDYITKLAKKYDLNVLVNSEKNGIGCDFDFASNCVDSKLVTIAHQDDIYDYEYSYNVIKEYEKHQRSLIIFTDYYEIRNENKIMTNTNLIIKRFLLFPLKFRIFSKYKFVKRCALRLGNAICCPSVTFVKDNVPKYKFSCNMKCNIDWYAWEKISKLKGSFIYISKKLMGHRISLDSTTTKIIQDNIRTKEDLIMFKKFWPNFFAENINKLYAKAEKSNNL